MLATERLIEIELLCAGKAHHIEVLESDGGYLHTGDKRDISSSSQNCLEDVMAYIFSGK